MCKHEYKSKNFKYYYDYLGYKITVVYYVCKKCGKRKRIKYF